MNTDHSLAEELDGSLVTLQTVLICLLGVIKGTLLAAQFLPVWLP